MTESSWQEQDGQKVEQGLITPEAQEESKAELMDSFLGKTKELEAIFFQYHKIVRDKTYNMASDRIDPSSFATFISQLDSSLKSLQEKTAQMTTETQSDGGRKFVGSVEEILCYNLSLKIDRIKGRASETLTYAQFTADEVLHDDVVAIKGIAEFWRGLDNTKLKSRTKIG